MFCCCCCVSFSLSLSNLFARHLPLSSVSALGPARLGHYVQESLDLPFVVDRDTMEGLGGTSGLRYLKAALGSEP